MADDFKSLTAAIEKFKGSTSRPNDQYHVSMGMFERLKLQTVEAKEIGTICGFNFYASPAVPDNRIVVGHWGRDHFFNITDIIVIGGEDDGQV